MILLFSVVSHGMRWL